MDKIANRLYVTVVLDKWYPRQAITNYTIPPSGLEVVANHEEFRQFAKAEPILPSYRRATSEGDTVSDNAVTVPRKTPQVDLWEKKPWLRKGYEAKVWLVRSCILSPFTPDHVEAIAARLCEHYPPEPVWRREIEVELDRIDVYALQRCYDIYNGMNGRRRKAVIARHNVKRRWQALGVWNPAWVGCPGDFSAGHHSWTWRWQTENGEDEEAVRQKAIAVVKRALHLREGMVRGETVPVIPRTNLSPQATASQAEAFIISRPWFMYQLELADEEMRHSRAPLKERKHIDIDSPTSIVTRWWKERGDWRDKATEVHTEISWKWRHETPEPPFADLSPMDNMINSTLDGIEEMGFSPSEIAELEKIESGFYDDPQRMEEEDNTQLSVEENITNEEEETRKSGDFTVEIQNNSAHPSKEAPTTNATPGNPPRLNIRPAPYKTPGELRALQERANPTLREIYESFTRPRNITTAIPTNHHHQQTNQNELPQASAVACGSSSASPRTPLRTTAVAGVKRRAESESESPAPETAPPNKKVKPSTSEQQSTCSGEVQQQQLQPTAPATPVPVPAAPPSSRPVPARRPRRVNPDRREGLNVQLGRAAVERARARARARAMRFSFALSEEEEDDDDGSDGDDDDVADIDDEATSSAIGDGNPADDAPAAQEGQDLGQLNDA